MIKYIKMHIKTKLEYKVSFILTSISQIITILSSIFVLYSLFDKFGALNDFNIYDCLLAYSIVNLGYYISEIVFRGFDHFNKLIKKGNFDILLIRPENIYLQILGTECAFEKLPKVIISLILLIYSIIKCNIVFSITNIFIILTSVIGAVIIFACIFILGACVCFYTIEGLEIVNIFTDGTRELGCYPLGIYGKKVLFIFTFIIPLSLINYYPILYLLNKSSNLLYAFLPLISCLVIIPTILIFNHGLKKYKSCG